MPPSNQADPTMERHNAAAGEAQVADKGHHSGSKSHMPSPSDDLRLEVAQLRAQLKAQTADIAMLQRRDKVRTAELNDTEQRKRVMRQRLSSMASEYEATKQEKRDMAEELDRLRQERTAANRRYRELQKDTARAKGVFDKERQAWDKLESSLKAQCREYQTNIKGLQKLLKPDQLTDPSDRTGETQGANDNAAPQSSRPEAPAGEPHIPKATDIRPMQTPAHRESAKWPAASPRQQMQLRPSEPPRRRTHVAESVTSEYRPPRRSSAGVAKTSNRPSRASAGQPTYASPTYDEYSVFGGR